MSSDTNICHPFPYHLLFGSCNKWKKSILSNKRSPGEVRYQCEWDLTKYQWQYKEVAEIRRDAISGKKENRDWRCQKHMSLRWPFCKVWSYLYAAKHKQRLDPEVSHAPSGLLGTEALLRNTAMNIQVSSESSNLALKKREASLEEGKKKLPLFLLSSC